MNTKDREVMAIVYQCVNKITGMYPTNPANVDMKFRYLGRIHEGSKHLLHALSNLNYEDYEDALECANEALEVLSQ